MDWTHFLSVLSFAIGVAAGFQGIYERYPDFAVRAAWTRPGRLYLATRGVLPAAVFCFSKAQGFMAEEPFALALICGGGAEILLRTRLHLRTTTTKEGAHTSATEGVQAEENETASEANARVAAVGFFDLLKFWQNYFLKLIQPKYATWRIDLVERHDPKLPFLTVLEQIEHHLPAFNLDATEKATVSEQLTNVKQKHETEPARQERYRRMLLYVILNNLGEEGFRAIFPLPSVPPHAGTAKFPPL